MNELILAKANEKLQRKNVIDPETWLLKLVDFIGTIWLNCDPAVYGKQIIVRFLQLSEGFLKPICSKRDLGDFMTRNGKIVFEAKTSVLHKDGYYGLKNLRLYQVGVDFIFFMLIDTSDNFNVMYFCVPTWVIYDNPNLKLNYQNGSKKSNKNNENSGMAVSFHKDKVSELFDEHNIFEGTKYKDAMKAFFVMAHFNHTTKNYPIKPSHIVPMGMKSNVSVSGKTNVKQSQPVNVSSTSKTTETGRKYKPKKKVSFLLDGKLIEEDTNSNTVNLLFKEIGLRNLLGVVAKNWICETRTRFHQYTIDGVHYTPRMSFRDIKHMVKMINRKTEHDLLIY